MTDGPTQHDSEAPAEHDAREAVDVQRLRRLVRALPYAVAHIDNARRCTFVSAACAQLLGREPSEIVGRPVSDVLGSESYALARPYIDAALAGDTSRFSPDGVLPAHGFRRFDVTCAPDRSGSGAVEGCFVTIVDVTEQTRVDLALRESEARFREMADGLPLIVWVHDANGEQEFVNETFCRFFGVSREQMKGGQWQILMHPADAEAYTAEFMRCVQERREFNHEVRVKRADGAWRWIESWGRPRFTASGLFRGFVGTSADVTARREAEDALRSSEQALRQSDERFRQLADAMPQLVWIASDDGAVTYYNSRAEQYGGLERESNGRFHWQPVVHPDEHDATAAAWRAAVAGDSPTYEHEHRLRLADGSYRWHLSRAYRQRNHDGEALWFGTATDIHERKVAEAALREADRRKDEFLAMLGHELRNPLSAIRSATELVQSVGTEDAQLQRAYGVLHRQAVHMERLIEDLLEVSRIARGKIQLDRETFDLRTILNDVVHDRAREIASRDLVVHEEHVQEELWVAGDPVRLAQVFDNLVGNAIKFTNRRGVITVVSQRDGQHVVVSVKDTGAGISAELLPRIFDPFQQGPQDIARGTGGLGLGLALAKELVEMHGGSIEAHSAGLGAGTELRVRLPLTSPRADLDAPSVGDGATQAGRILVVEDNADAAEMLCTLLAMQGYEVEVASEGARALAQLRQRRADIVICDLGLPDIDGYEVARAVRADAALRDTVLIALSGYGQLEDRQRTREAGFDEHLVKPVSVQALTSAIGQLLR